MRVVRPGCCHRKRWTHHKRNREKCNATINKHKINMQETLPPINLYPVEPPPSCTGVYVHV